VRNGVVAELGEEQEIQALLESLLASQASPPINALEYLSTTVLFDPIVDGFLASAQLIVDGPPTTFDLAQPYSGRELVYVGFADRQGTFRRRGVRRADGDDLRPLQRKLLVAFQRSLLTMFASPASQSEEIVGMLATRLMDHAIARVIASELGANEPLAFGFQQELLNTLRDLLLCSYEGKPATIAIVVASNAIEDLRWTDDVQKALRHFLPAKIARVLSDGVDPVFVFSPSGEFFGLHRRSELAKKLATPTRTIEWRIRQPQTLLVRIADDRAFELFGGTWRFVDDAGMRKVLGAVKVPADLTACLAKLAIELSEQRYGGLILVVDDVEAFRIAGCCNVEELNIPGDAPRLKANTPGAATANHGRVDLDHLKTILLEQFKHDGRKAMDLGVETLVRLARVDGALIVTPLGELLGFGVILSPQAKGTGGAIVEGARTMAAKLSSEHGVAIKISSDGPISIYRNLEQIFPPRS
jgi:hypothetical protein